MRTIARFLRLFRLTQSPLKMKSLLAFIVVLLGNLTPSFAQIQAPIAPNLHPQLTAQEAQFYGYQNVINHGSTPWHPLSDALLTANNITPDYVVDMQQIADNRTHFSTLQACINQVILDAQTAPKRRFILVMPGVYESLLYVPKIAGAVTIYGLQGQAERTIVRANLDASVTGLDYQKRFAAQFEHADIATLAMFDAIKNKPYIGTDGSATVWVMSDLFQAKNITLQNSYAMPVACAFEGCHQSAVKSLNKGNNIHHQAVAMLIEGADKVLLDNVRLLGHQDTLYLKKYQDNSDTRSFFNHCYIEGDVDFIFGDTIGYFYQSQINSLSTRSVSYAIAPATSYRATYGFVFEQCIFSSDFIANNTKPAPQFYLARQWFHNQKCTPYAPVPVANYQCLPAAENVYNEPHGTINQTVLENVGKVIVLHSTIGAHIQKNRPRSDWNTVGSIAYRPAQFNSDDFWQNLLDAKISPTDFMGYASKKNPVDWFMAEFKNTYLSDD